MSRFEQRAVRATLAAAVVCLIPALAFAEAAPVAEDGKAEEPLFADTPCAEDYQIHCSRHGVMRSAFECVHRKATRNKIGGECAAWVIEQHEANQKVFLDREKAMLEACAEDIETHCAEFKEARPVTMRGCLSRARNEVSEQCADKLPPRGNGKQPGGAYFSFLDGSEPDNWREELRAKRQKGKAIRELQAEYERDKALEAAAEKVEAGAASGTSEPDAASGSDPAE